MKASSGRAGRQTAYWIATVLTVLALLGNAWPSFALGSSPATGSIYLELPMADTPDLSRPLEQALALPGCSLNILPGEPRLPVRTIQVLLPPDAVLDSISLEFSPSAVAELSGTHAVPAAAPLLSGDLQGEEYWNGASAEDLENGRLVSIYASDAYWPAEPVQIVSVGDQRGYRVLSLAYWPLAYNPVSGSVRQWGDASLTISYSRNARTASTPDVSGELAWDMLSQQLVNSEDRTSLYGVAPFADELGDSPNDSSIDATNDYVIVTTTAIRNTSTQLAAFAQCKQLAGHTVKIVTEGSSATATTYLSGATADARANNIRAWLKGRYASEGIQYVLLIGNPHPDTFDAATSVPMKMTNPYQTTPTDMFYSDLSGTWDLNGNGTFGEIADIGAGGIDRLPEVTVGRVSFYNSYADLDAILSRFITYSSATGDLSWRNRAIIAAAISNHGPQDNNNDGTADLVASQRTFGSDWGEAIKGMLATSGVSAYTLYEKNGVYADGSAYPATPANAGLSTANLINAWKDGYGLVTWWGHGNYLGAYRRVWANEGARADHITQYPQETSTLQFFYSGDTFQLNNARPAFVVQVSCLNGQPEYLDNLGYRLLVNGSVGTVSSTRLSWYLMGAWTPQTGDGWADNASMGYRILERMSTYKQSLGDGLAHWRAYSLYHGSGGLWMNLLGANLYGDPSLSLESAGDPCEVAPTTPESPLPSSGTTGVEVETDLAWSGGHSCLSETVTYDVYLGTGGVPSTRVCSGSSTTCDPGTLENGLTYSWKVVASSSGGSTESPTWSFGTEEAPCSVPPTVPHDPMPADGATGVSLRPTLTWCGGHACEGEVVTYDVNLRKQGGDSTAACTGLDTASCATGPLEENSTYEWQVVSMGLNGPSIGPWWSFTTASCPLVGAVTLSSPAEAQSYVRRDEPVLAWNAAANASSYQVQVFADAGLTQVALDTSAGSTSLTLARYSPDGTYYWRVRGLASDQGCATPGAWSAVRAFVIEPLDLPYRLLLPVTFRP